MWISEIVVKEKALVQDKLILQDTHRHRYLHNASRQKTKNKDPPYQPQVTIVNIQPDDNGGDNKWVEVGLTKLSYPNPAAILHITFCSFPVENTTPLRLPDTRYHTSFFPVLIVTAVVVVVVLSSSSSLSYFSQLLVIGLPSAFHAFECVVFLVNVSILFSVPLCLQII